MSKAKIDQINLIKLSRSRERDKLDNILLIIAAGTLSLSATLVQSSRSFVGKNYLFAAWLFLVAGLLSILFGYVFAELHFKNLEKSVKEDKFNSLDVAENNCWFKLIEISNSVSFITIVIGIILFVYFGYCNI